MGFVSHTLYNKAVLRRIFRLIKILAPKHLTKSHLKIALLIYLVVPTMQRMQFVVISIGSLQLSSNRTEVCRVSRGKEQLILI